MKVIKEKIEIGELKEMSEKMFGNLVKVMIDVEKEIMAVDAPMHSDLLEFLMEKENCEPKDLWGINIYPEKFGFGNDFIEFDSMMNFKPGLGNKSRGIEDEKIREKIIEIVKKLT
jgi:hypothetical protein